MRKRKEKEQMVIKNERESESSIITNKQEECRRQEEEEPNKVNVYLLKNDIENMSKTNQLKMLRIIKANSQIKINKNKNGLFMNMSLMPECVLLEMSKLNEYIKEQEKELEKYEKKKEIIQNSFFQSNSSSFA